MNKLLKYNIIKYFKDINESIDFNDDDEDSNITNYSKKFPIENWLLSHHIDNFTINDDFTIDGYSVTLLSSEMNNDYIGSFGYKSFIERHPEYTDVDFFEEEQLPDYIRFNKINFLFAVCNNNLKTCVGFPTEMGRLHIMSNSLTKIDVKIDKVQYVSLACKNLTSLENLPDEGIEQIHAQDNKLTDLSTLPLSAGEVYLSNNLISTLDNCRLERCNLLDISNNKLFSNKQIQSIRY